jgi:thymidylate synthase (FAD)
MATDLSVVNSARVSFAQRSELVPPKEMNDPYPVEDVNPRNRFFHNYVLADKDVGLIKFLMRERHGTPFEHNAFRFHVKAPIFVFREWQRHRIGSFNEWSARYSKLEPEFYIPTEVRTQVGKPGSYTFEPVHPEYGEVFRGVLESSCQRAFRDYEKALDDGVAKEQARLFLPVNIYSQMYWTINARSLMNFLSLRNSAQAQWEIREYAVILEELFKEKMPVTYQAFVDNNRVAP